MPYSPASATTTTSGINHLAQIHYDDVAVENLKAHLPFYAACDRKMLPFRSGKTLQIFTYNLFGANTVASAEGVVGSGITPSSTTANVTINQYDDFVTFADMLVQTAIDPIVANTAEELGYRGALTTNQLLVNTFEAAIAADTTGAANNQLAHGSFFSRQVAQQAVMSLLAQNVRYKDDGTMHGIIHPLVAHDLMNDAASGGTLDFFKFTSQGQQKLYRGVQGYEVADIMGGHWVVTTTVPTYTISTHTYYGAYMVGKDAIFAINLGTVQVPKDEKNFKIMVNNNLGPSAADPSNKIGATCAYNFKFGAIQRPGGVQALRRIQSETSIA